MRTHEHIVMADQTGGLVKAVAPMIVSASRATDIPALFSPWFFDRLDKGYCEWKNPYSGKKSYISFANTRFIVFWSKNPSPLLPYLPKLKNRQTGFYIQYTLNDYNLEGLEPNVPELTDRIDSFKRIVDGYGFGRAVWRFDPLILTDKIGIDELLAKVQSIASKLRLYGETCFQFRRHHNV